MAKNFLLLGAGYSSLALAQKIRAAFGNDTPIFGTTRHAEYVPLLKAAQITPIILDSQQDDTKIQNILAKTTHLIVTVPPQAEQNGFGLPSENLKKAAQQLEWLAYFSTLGVYGDAQGAWINETTPLSPLLPRNLARKNAEQEWQAFADSCHIPAAILRLGSIYGENLAPHPFEKSFDNKFCRNPFRRIMAGTARRIIKKDQVFNYIHVDDIAGATCHLAATNADGIFNLCDTHPSPPQDVISYAAQLMGKTPPPEEDFSSADISPAMRGFYQANRHASNLKLREAGYNFAYPDYKKGLKAIWESKSW